MRTPKEKMDLSVLFIKHYRQKTAPLETSYFRRMIDPSALRIGNYILHKSGVRILPVKCNFQHFELLSKGLVKEVFPIALKVDVLKKCGFIENEKYYQLPDVKEFILTLPVKGINKNEIRAYVAANSEPYARATVNELIITNNIHHLHQLQNLYYALTSTDLEVLI